MEVAGDLFLDDTEGAVFADSGVSGGGSRAIAMVHCDITVVVMLLLLRLWLWLWLWL